MRPAIALVPLLLAACESPSLQGFVAAAPAENPSDSPLSATEAPETLDPTPPPPPPEEARTVDEFDTTTEEDRAEALDDAEPATSGAQLGSTLATLGSPADPGIWLKTPLVSEVTPGRVVYQGQSINVELRPAGTSAGSGSQISLPAMRLIEAPLTEIVELTVFSR